MKHILGVTQGCVQQSHFQTGMVFLWQQQEYYVGFQAPFYMVALFHPLQHPKCLGIRDTHKQCYPKMFISHKVRANCEI